MKNQIKPFTLNKYFKQERYYNDLLGPEIVNSLNLKKIEEYEAIINKVYFGVYYQNVVLYSSYSSELDKRIKENNCLKPIFILFKLFYLIERLNDRKRINKEWEGIVLYLNTVPEAYFEKPYQSLYLLIRHYLNFESITQFNLHQLAPETLWKYYDIAGQEAYKNNRYTEALLYYQRAENLYLDDSNINRYSTSQNFISELFILTGKYLLAYKTMTPIFRYCFIADADLPHKKQIAQNYLMALFMLGRYEEVLAIKRNYIDDYKMSVTSEIILLFSYKRLKYKKEEVEYIRNENTRLVFEMLFMNRVLTKEERKSLEGLPLVKKIMEMSLIHFN